jgi:signal transduction histidine kinase
MATTNILQKLLEISRNMAETRELKPLLEYAIDVALELFSAEHGYIVLLNNDGSLDYRATRSRTGELTGDALKVSQSIFNRVVSGGEPVIIADAIVDPSFEASASVRSLQLRSVMCVPLIARGSIIGALYVENRSRQNLFRKEDLQLLEIFASHAAISIANAILNDELELHVQARTAELSDALVQLEHSWNEAVEANRVRTHLMGNIAHDIRSPLSTVTTTMYLIQDDIGHLLDDEQKSLMQMAQRTLDHLTRLTDDLFDMTRLVTGNLVLYPEPVIMETFLEELYEVAAALPWPDNVHFVLKLDPNLSVIALDPTRIKQVIYNLISNALKFTEMGTVTFYAHPTDEGGICIGVRDTGEGIAEEDLSRIFNRYEQVGDTKSRAKGAGLGLAICRELVELHGGSIYVESTPKRGSNFYFYLPPQPPQLEEAQD